MEISSRRKYEQLLQTIPNTMGPADGIEFITLMDMADRVGLIRNRLKDLQAKLLKVYLKSHIQNRNIAQARDEFEDIAQLLTRELVHMYGNDLVIITTHKKRIHVSKLMYLPNDNVVFMPEVETHTPRLATADIATMPYEIKAHIIEVQVLYNEFLEMVDDFLKSRLTAE